MGEMRHVSPGPVLLPINGSKTPARQGIDTFQLIRDAGEWRIISVTNDRPSPDNPIPTALFD